MRKSDFLGFAQFFLAFLTLIKGELWKKYDKTKWRSRLSKNYSGNLVYP